MSPLGVGAGLAGVALAGGALGAARLDPLPLAVGIGLLAVAGLAALAGREEWLEHRHWPAILVAWTAMISAGAALIVGAPDWLAAASGVGGRTAWEVAVAAWLLSGIVCAALAAFTMQERSTPPRPRPARRPG